MQVLAFVRHLSKTHDYKKSTYQRDGLWTTAESSEGGTIWQNNDTKTQKPESIIKEGFPTTLVNNDADWAGPSAE